MRCDLRPTGKSHAIHLPLRFGGIVAFLAPSRRLIALLPLIFNITELTLNPLYHSLIARVLTCIVAATSLDQIAIVPELRPQNLPDFDC